MTASSRAHRRSLVGRRRELDQLSAAVMDASSGRGSVWLVCGEPGIGKSRLLEELEASTGASTAVHWGRCWEAGGAPAYWPWIQVLRSVLAGDRAAASVPARAAAQLAQLLPEASAGQAPGSGPPLEPGQARFALMDAVAATFRAAAAIDPLMVLLEDLHAADPASVTLLDFISRQMRTIPMLVVGSYREADAARHEAGAELASLAARVPTLRLARLDTDAVAACVREVTGTEPGPRVASAIHEATEGNPLFVVEIAALMSARGELEGVGDRVDIVVPDSVGAVIQERAVGFDAATRETLRVASVVGREFRIADAASLMGVAPGDLDRPVEEAAAAGILERFGADQCRFSHIVTREVFHSELEPGARRELHRRRADQLTAGVGEDRQPPWSEIAHHLLAAGAEADPRALEACVRAADQARSRLAFDDSADALARALEVVDRVPGTTPRRRCELMLERGRSLIDGGRVDSGRRVCLDAAAAARAMGDGELLARSALIYGSAFSYAEIDPALVALLREALAAVEEGDSPLRARLQARLAAALQPADDPQRPMQLARDAIAMARRTGDRRALLDAIRSGCSALMDLADPAERLAINREHIALADSLGEPMEALRGHLRVAIDSLDLGDVRSCERATDAYGAIATQTGLPHHLWPAASMRAMRAMMEGRFEAAERWIAESEQAAEKVQDPNARRTQRLQRIGLARTREDREMLGRLLDEAIAEPGLSGFTGQFVRVLSASARVRCGEEVPEGELEALMEEAVMLRDRSLACLAAEIAAAACDRSAAEALLEILEPHASLWVTWGVFGMVCECPMSRPLALLTSSLDRAEEAERRFREALAEARRVGARPLSARIGFELGRHLLQHGRAPEDTVRLLDEARRMAAGLRQPALLEQITELEQRFGGSGQPRSEMVPSVSSFSLARDGDVWLCTCGGESFRLKDTKGVRILARLVAEPGREMHVLDLSGTPSAEAVQDLGDAGEVLDATARAQYRRRVEELEAEIEEAERFNDRGRASKAREELDAIAAELSRAFGLGGRERRAGAAAERARVNVQRRLRDAVRRIGEHCPEAEQHLEWALKTGMFCIYNPCVS